MVVSTESTSLTLDTLEYNLSSITVQLLKRNIPRLKKTPQLSIIKVMEVEEILMF